MFNKERDMPQCVWGIKFILSDMLWYDKAPTRRVMYIDEQLMLLFDNNKGGRFES